MVQRTHIEDAAEWVEEGASRLLGLDGLAVQRVDLDAFGGRVVHLVTADEGAAACPSCGVISSSVKGHARTRPRDVPYGSAPVRLVWHKRRWRCLERRCSRASFTESVPQVPARARLTARLRAECGAGIAQRFSCVQAARSTTRCRGRWRTPRTSPTSPRP